MVQRKLPHEAQIGALERLKPAFRLKARVAKDQGARSFLKQGQHLGQAAQPEVPRPGEAFDFLWDKGGHRGRGALGSPDQAPAPGRAEQDLKGMVRVGHGGREAPAPGLRGEAIEPCQG